MIRALYTAASGLLSHLRMQEAVANNVANATTTGYKEDTSANESFNRVLAQRIGNASTPVPLTFRRNLGVVGTGTYQAERGVYLQQGTVTRTEEPLDVAILGPGFLATQGEGGQTFYTRNGHFTTDDTGTLMTTDGRAVLGVDGRPIVIDGEVVNIYRNGEVVVDDQPVGTIALYDIAPTDLVRAEGSAFTTEGPTTLLAAGREPRFDQGALEESNTDLASETTRLMSTSRQYEANQQLFREIASNLERVVNDVGRVGN
ncbi:MAG: flagellar hook-basal body protein [Dehalococcoidia bacterium]